MTKRIILLVCCFICASFFVQVSVAQQFITVPYSMGFEESDSVELGNWVLNPGTNATLCTDQWYVGEAVKSDGKRSLYISSDQGASAMFGVAQNVQYAYRDFVVAKGSYEICFDWLCVGAPDATFYAGVGPAANLNLQADSRTSVVPSSVMSWCKTLGAMKGTSLWKNASIKVNSNGTTVYRLFFVWTSANRDTTLVMPMGACIDNIQICSANCAKPKNIQTQTSCDSILVTWEGTSEKYSFEFRKRGRKWSAPTTLYANSFVLENIEEGLYDFRVRGICNDMDTSAYAYLNSSPVFCPEKHCINYVDLKDSVNVSCSYGSFENPWKYMGVQDFGPENKFSRHTVNWDPDLYDPRTCNQLPLVPDGELASIRLGNWNTGAEAESVSYTYVADVDNAAILLLKYAIVMEDPSHKADEQPRFTLEILGEDGSLISPTCGMADFYADAQRQDATWHTCSGAPGSSTIVSWKEWTTIGLNLAEVGVQTGDMLTIRLTTYDCDLSGHFGYAYFTLGCAAAKIHGTSCGNESVLSVAAPEGFLYEWYNKYDSLVATTKELSVDPSDTTTYRCRLVYKENSECDFNLYTAIYPRFPISEFTYSYQPSNCENKVIFTNKSHVMTIYNNDTVHHYDELCEEYAWNFGDGEESAQPHPVHIFPKEGGTFPVTLYSSISEGACVEDTTIFITLPAIGDVEQVVDSVICEGDYVVFGKYYAALEGLYYDSLKTVAGCDSVIILDLKVNPVTKTYLPDTTVCAEEPLCIDGDCYKHKTSGEFVRFLKNQYGCDSTVWMHVNMQDSILPVLQITEPVDEDNLGTVTISGTGYDYYYFNGERYDTTTTYFSGLGGGVLNFQFFNDFGCSIEILDTMNFECLGISLGELSFECVGSNYFVLPLVVDSGIPTTYSLLFDSLALAAGFADLMLQPIDKEVTEIRIPLHQDVVPGRYRMQLVVSDALPKCEDLVFDLELAVNFSANMIFQRWNDVLSVVAPQYNYNFLFDSFQWKKDGVAIEGATRSYYYEEDGLDVEAEYQVDVVLPNGVVLTTCPFTPMPYDVPQQAPQKIIENQQLIILRNNVRYNAQGAIIQEDK